MISPVDDIYIETWDEETFRNSRDEWNELLSRSSCDQFFLSWEWLYSWWDIFNNQDSMSLNIIAARNKSGALVGIAPLYLHKIKAKWLISSNNLQFIGNCWRGMSSMRTELMEFITDTRYSGNVITQFYNEIFKNKMWDELILSNLLVNSDTYTLLGKFIHNNFYTRSPESYFSYHVDNNSNFKDYLAGLGKNTRLKLYNRRKVLENVGETTYIPNNNRSISENFDLLNSFHVKRWGKPAFTDKILEFNLLISELFNKNDSLIFSEIKHNEKPISLQYNFNVNNRIYNIQSGFVENFNKKLALGYLHFGYEIERIFDKGIKNYDFLAGDGKNTNYKASLTTQKTEIINIQVIRNMKLQIIYRLYDFIKKQ